MNTKFTLHKFFTALVIIATVLFIYSFDRSVSISSPESAGTGIRSYVHQDTAIAVTSSTSVVGTSLTFNVAANAKYHVRYALPFTLGGTAPGIKFLVDAPSSPTLYNSSAVIYSNAPALSAVSVITSEAAQGVTLATAGNHVSIIEFDLTNGSTAGAVTLRFAQNVSDAAATTLMAGAYAEITNR